MADTKRKRQGGFWYGRKGPRSRCHSRQAHRGTKLRLEPLEARHLLSAGSWGVADGGEYNDVFSDAAYAPDGSSLYALSVIQESEHSPTNLSGYAVDGQELFNAVPILNGASSVQRLLVADNDDIFVASQYGGGASVSGEASPLPVFGGSDIVVARFSMDTGSPVLAWWRAFGSAENDRLAAIELVDNGPGDPSVCVVGNFGQALSLWDGATLSNTSGADHGTFAVVADAADGHLQYSTELNDSGAIRIQDAAVTDTGELYVVGSFSGRDVQIGDDSFSEHQWISQAIIAKYQMDQASIEPLWAYQIADSEGRSFARSVVPGPDGTVFVAGTFTDVADFGTMSLPSSSDNVWALFHNGFLVQVAEDTPGQPGNAWVRWLAGDVLPTDLQFTDDTLYVACGFDREVDLDLGAGTRGNLVSRGSGDVAVVELQLEVEAGRVVGDELGRVWQMEYADDDVPDLDVNRYPGQAMIDVSTDGRVAIATASSSEIALTPVGAMITQGGRDGVLLDIAPDYPLVEVTTTEPVLGQSAAGLAARAQYPFDNADLIWEWQLWRLDDTGGRILVQDGNNNADPAQMTFINQLVLGDRYEAVITVTNAAPRTTEYSYKFDVGLDPPENLTAAVATHDTVTVTWDLPDNVGVGDGFVIEADCTTGHPFYWDLVGQVTVTADDIDNGKMSATVGMTRIVYRWQEGLRYRVRSYRGTPEAMDLLSPAAVVYVPEPGTEPPPAPSFSIDDVAVTEGDSGSTTATFTVRRSGDLSGTDTVDFDTVDETATTADNDYLPAAGTLSFAPDVTTRQVSVTIFGDERDEGDETFLVNLSNPSTGASIAEGSGVATIVNDDAPLTSLYIADIRFESGHGGNDWRVLVEVRSAADDSLVEGVSLRVDFAGTTYEVVTDADGVARTGWQKKLAPGDYYANAYDLALEGYVWDPLSLLNLEDDSDGDGRPDDWLSI